MENQERVFCQSCAMPLDEEALHGTNADGTKNEDYCTYCYQNGAFTTEVTMQEMMDECLPHMVEGGMPEADAKAMMEEVFPHLKRWQS
ncbi:zinc ribbon domain-containing protein [Ruminococcaceae bacterium OttesenSCG-928-O06]|nr:zinc ribbon domain-containing protein [Ruminococcaceae bacterium OttesenSCG-928-O06]